MIIIDANRLTYDPKIAATRSMTVKELIEKLNNYDDNEKVIISNDLIYGEIRVSDIYIY